MCAFLLRLFAYETVPMETKKDTNRWLWSRVHTPFRQYPPQMVRWYRVFWLLESVFAQSRHKSANLFFRWLQLMSNGIPYSVSPYGRVSFYMTVNMLQYREGFPGRLIVQKTCREIDPNRKIFWYDNYLYTFQHIFENNTVAQTPWPEKIQFVHRTFHIPFRLKHMV